MQLFGFERKCKIINCSDIIITSNVVDNLVNNAEFIVFCCDCVSFEGWWPNQN